jgi:hypothetical protein
MTTKSAQVHIGNNHNFYLSFFQSKIFIQMKEIIDMLRLLKHYENFICVDIISVILPNK